MRTMKNSQATTNALSREFVTCLQNKDLIGARDAVRSSLNIHASVALDEKKKEIANSLFVEEYGDDDGDDGEGADDDDQESDQLEEQEDDCDCAHEEQEKLSEEYLTEVAAKRKIVIRNGKRVVKYMCPPGHKKNGRKCLRVAGAEKMKRKRRAIRSARKRRAKKNLIVRKRRKSLRRRQSQGLNKRRRGK